ncbi:Txe/YoeB family addiction module toxin [Nocardia testacea]|uniref:Txe/YoeB family addiction module toxin n=1 Tax=Nocardia testacea TaxID=248551 RepID=UPI003A8A894A
MRIAFTDEGWEDFMYWALKERKQLKRIGSLITDIKRDPYGGIGKPERLKYFAANVWSRRIDAEHRLVYAIVTDEDETTMVVMQARYHYGNK